MVTSGIVVEDVDAKVRTSAPLPIVIGSSTTLVSYGIDGEDVAAKLVSLAPLSVVAGGSTTLVSSGIAAKLDALTPLSVAAGGSTTLVSSGIAVVEVVAKLGTMAPLSIVAGGSTAVVSSGIGSSIVVPVRVRCVNCLGTGREPQLVGLPLDPVCHICWGYGRVWSRESMAEAMAVLAAGRRACAS